MAGLPALRGAGPSATGTATRRALAPAALAGADVPHETATPPGGGALRPVEPAAPLVAPRPRNEAAALLLALAREEAARDKLASGGRQAARPCGGKPAPLRAQAERACLAYRRQGAQPELYDEGPAVFRLRV